MLALALAACSGSVPGTGLVAGTTGASGGTSGVPSASAPASPAAVPAGLEKFYSQELDWGSCAKLATSDDNKFYRSASLQCADLTVPLAYDDPTGPARSR